MDQLGTFWRFLISTEEECSYSRLSIICFAVRGSGISAQPLLGQHLFRLYSANIFIRFTNPEEENSKKKIKNKKTSLSLFFKVTFPCSINFRRGWCNHVPTMQTGHKVLQTSCLSQHLFARLHSFLLLRVAIKRVKFSEQRCSGLSNCNMSVVKYV